LQDDTIWLAQPYMAELYQATQKNISITDFPNHWANLPKSMTSYSSNMVKPKSFKDKLQPGTPTIFIKKEKYTDKVEKSWSGTMFDIQQVSGSIFFRVEIEKEIACPEEYAERGSGS
jgi:hypothetical protein